MLQAPRDASARVCAWLFVILVLAPCLDGCTAISQDVHQYYRQMAFNYREAEEKAKMDAMTLEGESRMLLQAGDLNKYNRTRKELARIRDWQARCARQRERFEQAGRSLEGPPDSGKTPGPKTEHPPGDSPH